MSGRALGGHPRTPQPRSFVCLHEWRGPAPPRPGTRVGSLWGNLRGAAGAPRAWSPGVKTPWSVRQTPVRVQAGGCNFPGAQARRYVPARCLTRTGAPPPCRLSRRPSPGTQGLPRSPVGPCRALRGSRGPQRPISSPLALSTGPCLPIRVRGRNGARCGSAPKCLLGSGSQKQNLGGPAGLRHAGR